ncbi:MAG: hypothetical protein NVS9B4_17370 [Candidatus Acidiferrum sp.]
MTKTAKVLAIPVLMFAMLLPAIVSVNASISTQNAAAPMLQARSSYPPPPPDYPARNAKA